MEFLCRIGGKMRQKLGKRSRYYHGQIDVELLLSGSDYIELPDTYVIFICDFDPFGKGKYRYTFQNQCLEDSDIAFEDGSRSIFLSTCGQNKDEVSVELVKFLEFVGADLENSMVNFEDEYITRLQNTIREIKRSREMEERFMIFEEMLKDEHADGKAEGKAEAVLMFLSEIGSIPDELAEKIMNEKDLTVLNQYLKCAANAKSIEDFLKEIK